MELRVWLFGLLLVAALVASACGGAARFQDAELDMANGERAMSSDDHVATAEPKGSEDPKGGDCAAATTEKAASEIGDGEAPPATMEAGHKEDTVGGSDSESDGDSSIDTMESEPRLDLPTWFSAELSDVNTGATLAVSDLFKNRVVLVETMAIWCSNCLRQQQEVKVLHEELGERDDLVTLVLDVDANEDAGDLKAYAEKHGFTWIYTVAPREVAREIGQLYGDQFLNPPSTPMLIVDRQGEVHLLPFGRKTAKDLQEALAPFLDAEM